MPYIDSIFGGFSADSTSEVFMGNLLSVLLVFLVCGNVALLMFARAATRENEILVRTALGAGRGRIIGQLFVEALVLATVAALVAVTFAQVAWHSLFAMVTENMFDNRVPFWMHSSVSPRTLVYAALLTLVAAAIAGLLPGLKVTRGIGTRLRQSSPGGGGLRFGGIWTVLIVMQVAVMAIVPTPVIAIYGDVARWARAANAGLVPEQYLAVTMAMDGEKVPGAAGSTFTGRFTAATQELERRLEAEPGVTGVTVASVLPLMDHPSRQIDVDEGSAAPADRNSSHRRVSSASVALDFFDVLDTPILSGRAFHSGDLQPGARTVIVNQSFAQVVFGGSNPIGRRLRYGGLTQQNATDPQTNRGIKSWASCGISASIRKTATRGATRGGPASITRWFLAEVIPSAWPSIPWAIPCSSPHACGPSPEMSSPRFRSRRSPASIKSLPQVPAR